MKTLLTITILFPHCWMASAPDYVASVFSEVGAIRATFPIQENQSELNTSDSHAQKDLGVTTGSEAPKCPSYDQVYHAETRKCFKASIHSQGPCEPLMAFVESEPKPGFGDCVCGLPKKRCGRPLGYWPDHKRCYELFAQGPCEEGDWLVPAENGSSKCERNVCQVELADESLTSDSTKEVFTFAHEGICYRTETQAFCNTDFEVARFLYGEPGPACYHMSEPLCTPFPHSDHRLSLSETASCPIGHVEDSRGECFRLAD